MCITGKCERLGCSGRYGEGKSAILCFFYRTFIWGLCVEHRPVSLEKCAHWLDIRYGSISIRQGICDSRQACRW